MGIRLDTVKESLLAELERLDGLRGDDLKEEIARAKAKVELAGQVNAYVSNQIATARLVVQTREATSTEVATAIGGLLESPESDGTGTPTGS